MTGVDVQLLAPWPLTVSRVIASVVREELRSRLHLRKRPNDRLLNDPPRGALTAYRPADDRAGAVSAVAQDDVFFRIAATAEPVATAAPAVSVGSPDVHIEVPADTAVDLAAWLREIFQRLIAYGGPVLAFQVFIIFWLLGAQVNADTRQQISELAGLIALALALAPEFRKVAKRLSSPKDDDAK